MLADLITRRGTICVEDVCSSRHQKHSFVLQTLRYVW